MVIDAPEKKQVFGNMSKEHLSFLVFNKQDKYGRIKCERRSKSA